jgi:adenylate kinase family enzyme
VKRTCFLFLGAPISGKGNFVKLLRYFMPGIKVVDVGFIFRQNNFSEEITNIVNSGKLVDSGIVFGIIKNYLPSDQDFILDGFPKKIDQIDMIIDWCRDNGFQLKLVIFTQSIKKTLEKHDLRKQYSDRKDDGDESFKRRIIDYEKYILPAINKIAGLYQQEPTITSILSIDSEQLRGLWKDVFSIR